MVLPPIAGLSYTGYFPNHVTNGVDYSWLVGLLVSGLVYLVLSRSLDLASEQAAIDASASGSCRPSTSRPRQYATGSEHDRARPARHHRQHRRAGGRHRGAPLRRGGHLRPAAPAATRWSRPTWPSSASRSTAGSATGPAPASARPTSASRPGCSARTTPRCRSRCSPASRSPTPATWPSTRSASTRRSAPSSGARGPCWNAPALVLTLGGDHTIALPMLRAVAARHGPVAVVHFDAHLDTWDTYFGAAYTHGTPFRRASEEGLLDRTRLPARRHPRPAVHRRRPDRGLRARLPGDPGARGRAPRRGRHGRAHRRPGRRPARSTSRSTSTCSTRRTRPAPAPRRRAA